MSNTAGSRRLLAAVLLLLGLCGVLLTASPASAVTSADRLSLSWAENSDELLVQGFGYRPDAVVDVKFGAELLQPARSDKTGRVQVRVPGVTAGQPGVSIVLTGRAVSGTARVLVSSVPPRAAVGGPIDSLPWLLAAGVAIAATLEIWHLRRVRRRRATAAAA